MTTERSNGVPGTSLLIETLLPGAEPTVLADHGAPRAWAPLPRIGGTPRHRRPGSCHRRRGL